jgi:large subunit ribosomal protein L22
MTDLIVIKGKHMEIRGSPWKLNLIAKQIRGLRVEEAMRQLAFSTKAKADLVSEVIRKTTNLADIRHRLQPSELEIAECFTTHGKPLKRIQFKAKGRFGRMQHKFSHLWLKIREIDYDVSALSRTFTSLPPFLSSLPSFLNCFSLLFKCAVFFVFQSA